MTEKQVRVIQKNLETTKIGLKNSNFTCFMEPDGPQWSLFQILYWYLLWRKYRRCPLIIKLTQNIDIYLSAVTWSTPAQRYTSTRALPNVMWFSENVLFVATQSLSPYFGRGRKDIPQLALCQMSCDSPKMYYLWPHRAYPLISPSWSWSNLHTASTDIAN